MKINLLSKVDFFNLVYNSTSEFLNKIEKPEVFIVKDFYPKNEILDIRNITFENGKKTEPSWHPCFDD